MRTLIFTLLTSFTLAACDNNSLPTTDPTVRFSPNQSNPHWTVINYWAKWCAPCRDEIPELNAFATAHADQVRVLGVNYDGLQGEELNADIEALDIRFPVLLDDPHRALAIERPTALPSTLIISPDGAIRDILLGPQTEASLKAAMATADNP